MHVLITFLHDRSLGIKKELKTCIFNIHTFHSTYHTKFGFPLQGHCIVHPEALIKVRKALLNTHTMYPMKCAEGAILLFLVHYSIG